VPCFKREAKKMRAVFFGKTYYSSGVLSVDCFFLFVNINQLTK
jgi:hypothetical protein